MPVLNLHKVKRGSKIEDVERLVQWLADNVGEKLTDNGFSEQATLVEDTEKYIVERRRLYIGNGWEIYNDETSSKRLTEDQATSWSRDAYYVDITDSKQALMFSMKWL
jgi:hypothetical protein